MERADVEDQPLLRGEEESGVAFQPLDAPQSRSQLRVRRADLVCLSIMGFVASFLLVWQPSVRPIGSLTHDYDSLHAANTHEAPIAAAATPTYKYLTYDDIDADKRKNGYTVSYDKRGFTVDGRTTLLLGGSIHYPRSTPPMWEDLLRKAKNDGLNHIELYVFWSLHEPTRETFHFEDRANLTLFFDAAVKVGLFLNVRYGPYACAEWNNGGLPYWLDRIPGMDIRSSNAQWKQEMSRFLKKIVDITRPYLAKNGGPIIMAQIENEYGWNDDAYVEWCGQMTTELDISVPWMMCNGKAASNTILTCNANDCIDFANSQNKNRPKEPFMWTENEGWFQTWESPPSDADARLNTSSVKGKWDDRDPEEMAYTVARWFAVGAAHHNYYMYHGGNNFGRSASAGVTTKYTDGVNLHHDGLSHEPKRTHLRKLHEALIACNEVLLSNDRQLEHPVSLGADTLKAFVYGKKGGDRVVFLENSGTKDATVAFDGTKYHLQPTSVIILKNGVILYDTSAVRQSYPHQQQRVYSELVAASSLNWDIWTEDGDHHRSVVDTKPLEQLSVTDDETDYLTYRTKFTLSAANRQAKELVLNFTGTDANGYLVVINGKLVGEVHRAYPGESHAQPFTLKLPSWIQEDEGKEHDLALVSVGFGLWTLGKRHVKGITGEVKLNGQSLIGTQQWKMDVGLIGEHLRLHDPRWFASVPWKPFNKEKSEKPMMSWYKTTFKMSAPPKRNSANPVEETTSILLDCVGLSRGHVFINGHDLGRHWLIKDKNGDYVQRYYQIPPDWLRTDDNTENDLVVFDEIEGSVSEVRLVLSSMIEDSLDLKKEILENTKRFQPQLNAQTEIVTSEERRAS